ncbi:MAG: flagellar hook protein FlgE [Spirochaetales bacterium]|jgi:flagellar hook protein FlgE|nr:flagellar hook protein FlgE [Spirochaetales bacterium]
MMRSLYAGVSGLQNHQTRMDVVGNNIANVNTTGFKKGRVNFQDLISQNVGGAARPTEELGGVNPKQVGLGMNVASIDTIHTQGAIQLTGKMSDLALMGEGFFILRTGKQDLYTRNGTFDIDENGTLVNPANGMRVQGWSATTVDNRPYINTSDSVGDLIIPINSKDPAVATTEVQLACNLNKNTPEIPENPSGVAVQDGTWQARINVYDSFGNEHTLQINFTRRPDEVNRWNAEVTVDPEYGGANTIVEVGAAGNSTTNTFVVEFGNLGTLLAAEDGAGDRIAQELLQVQVAFDVAGATPGEGGAPVRQTFNLNLGEVGNPEGSMTQFADPSSTKVREQNGFGMGYMTSYRIDQSGVITGIFSNGNNRPLGQIALATFMNPGGLEKQGENVYSVTNNSGIALVDPAGIAGKGKILAGNLEMSNVDLAEQFTDMIVTQRGFQANSRTIQTADQLLQELLTLKR